MDDPVNDPKAPASEHPMTLADLDLVRVLVVEDDASLRRLAQTVLEGAGCRIATVGDGRDALSSATLHPPDVVVLDVSLPGMGGREVARTLHWDPATSETRFVIVTGSVESRRVLTEWEVQPDAVLQKPYDPVDLVDAVLEAARRGMRVVHLPDGERQKV